MFTTNQKYLIFSREKTEKDVGMILSKKTSQCLMGHCAIRVLLVKLKIKQQTYIQVYRYYTGIGTNFGQNRRIEQFLQTSRRNQNEVMIVMGDLNAKVRKGREENVSV